MSETASKIGIQLANGKYFALYKGGEMGKKHLQLVPARNDQNVAEIRFVHYGTPGSEPVSIGKIRCTDIQPEKNTLTLNMNLSDSDNFTVSADYFGIDSNPVKTKETKFKLKPSDTPDTHGNKPQKPTASKKILRCILGILFVVICLLIIFYAVNSVTEWGSFRAFTHPAS